MTSLFSASTQKNEKRKVADPATETEVSSALVSVRPETVSTRSFSDLGLTDWVISSCRAMSFRKPTPIQQACVPAILEGRNVMGCAETGSGKTAAFALPILQHLSEDPYGVFAVILTPTRELAVQIEEQVNALGSQISVRTCLIIGGMGIIDQATALSKRPHIVIATPGRLRHHLESADAPNLSRSRYLVMDEADRLLMPGFEAELKTILGCMTSPARQTLLFSATMTTSLEKLESLAAMSNTLRFDLTTDQVIPTSLVQQYLFVPSQVKLSFLVAVIKRCIALQQDDDDSDGEGSSHKNKKQKRKGGGSSKQIGGGEDGEGSSADSFTLKSSMIIFVSTCSRCQLVHEVLLQFGIDCVTLHSLLTQNRRAAALGKFKSQVCKVLVATDVASRGLDIPEVDLVINLDIPKSPTEYVHRVGRTARAGRRGRSLSIITPQEVDLVHAIEDFTKQEMSLSTEVQNKDIVPLLNPLARSMKMAQLKMMEYGFDEKAEQAVERKKQNRKKLDKKESQKKKDSAKKEASAASSTSS